MKIEFEKAYDPLGWFFICDIMLKTNLPYLLINTIMECITSASVRMLWNGEPTHNLKPSRGIHQGDPLSPYLFVMCMERLYQTIEEAIALQKWKPIRASRNSSLISNMVFADDVVLFVVKDVNQVGIIQDCLKLLCN